MGGMVQTYQGGWYYRTYTRCEIGQYRAPCNNRCVFPDAGNMRGQCLNCTNAAAADNFTYTSAGGSQQQPYGNNNCSWACKSGYEKQMVNGNAICSLTP